MAIEIPSYTVLRKNGDKELRKYDPYVIAEVSMPQMEYDQAMGVGFEALADYIFGNNAARQKISMTAPVMAVQHPVKSYTVSFMMPSRYRKEDLPTPANEEVHLKKVPGYTAAVVRFSGSVTPEIVEQKKTGLQLWMKELGLKAHGEPVIARYNPPFTPWFLRRNEVILPIEE